MSRQTGLPGSHGLVGVHHDWIRDFTEHLHLSRSACISVNLIACCQAGSLTPVAGISIIHAAEAVHGPDAAPMKVASQPAEVSSLF